MDGYRIECFGPEHEKSIISLLSSIYGARPSLGEIHNKFSGQDLGCSAIGFIAYDDKDNPAAYYGVFPLRVVRNGETIVAAQSGDTMTHPAHQGKGLFTHLAKLTFEVARVQGIAFVFGYPNESSYPGFTKKLGWVHHRTMHSYSIAVPTLPMAEIANRFPPLMRPYRSYQNWITDQLSGVSNPGSFGSSVVESGEPGVLRDESYFNYKKVGLRTVTVDGVTIHFKVDRFLDIGDICANGDKYPRKAMRRIYLLAFLLGVVRIRYYVSPNSHSDRMLSQHLKPRAGLPYAHLALQRNVDPDEYNYTFLDYDTF